MSKFIPCTQDDFFLINFMVIFTASVEKNFFLQIILFHLRNCNISYIRKKDIQCQWAQNIFSPVASTYVEVLSFGKIIVHDYLFLKKL